jgi:lipid A 3-O-deacylase PagL
VSILLVAGVLPGVFPRHLLADQASGLAALPEGVQLEKGTVEIGGIVGTTLPVTLFRARTNRRLTIGSLQVGRIMTTQRGKGAIAGSFEFLLEVDPVLLLRQPQRTFGVAASPLHMRWNFAPMGSHPFQVFAEASGGIVYTNHAVPAGTTSFNFIDQAGFGLRLSRHPKRAWLLGYRFQHISNGGRVQPNPGTNFNFVYGGVSFLR